MPPTLKKRGRGGNGVVHSGPLVTCAKGVGIMRRRPNFQDVRPRREEGGLRRGSHARCVWR